MKCPKVTSGVFLYSLNLGTSSVQKKSKNHRQVQCTQAGHTISVVDSKVFQYSGSNNHENCTSSFCLEYLAIDTFIMAAWAGQQCILKQPTQVSMKLLEPLVSFSSGTIYGW